MAKVARCLPTPAMERPRPCAASASIDVACREASPSFAARSLVARAAASVGLEHATASAASARASAEVLGWGGKAASRGRAVSMTFSLAKEREQAEYRHAEAELGQRRVAEDLAIQRCAAPGGAAGMRAAPWPHRTRSGRSARRPRRVHDKYSSWMLPLAGTGETLPWFEDDAGRNERGEHRIDRQVALGSRLAQRLGGSQDCASIA